MLSAFYLKKPGKRTPKIQDAAGGEDITRWGDPGWHSEEAVPLGKRTKEWPLCSSLTRVKQDGKAGFIRLQLPISLLKPRWMGKEQLLLGLIRALLGAFPHVLVSHLPISLCPRSRGKKAQKYFKFYIRELPLTLTDISCFWSELSLYPWPNVSLQEPSWRIFYYLHSFLSSYHALCVKKQARLWGQSSKHFP